MKKRICIGLIFFQLFALAFSQGTEGNSPFQARLSRQQDLLVGDVVDLEFVGELAEANWSQYSSLPYPNLKSIRPQFVPGENSEGIEWAQGDLSFTINQVREGNDLTAPLVMNRHELVYAKSFRIAAKKASITGTLSGSYQTGFADSAETMTFALPVQFTLEARDSAVGRWLEASDKINNVLAVVVIIFIGLIVYTFITQRKLNKLSEMANELKKE